MNSKNYECKICNKEKECDKKLNTEGPCENFDLPQVEIDKVMKGFANATLFTALGILLFLTVKDLIQ